MEQGDTPDEAASLRVLGYVLATLGAIVLPLCGLCTGSVLFGGGRLNDNMFIIDLAMIFGGVPIASAIFALWWGIGLILKNPKPPKPPREGEP